MKHLAFLVGLIFLLYPEQGKSQITIHPEVGLSYFPFAYYENAKANFKRIDFLYGVSAYLPISDKLNAQTRISFTDREDIRFSWGDSRDYQYRYSDYIRSELNLDFRLNIYLTEFLNWGIGASLIRTFAEIKDTHWNHDNTERYTYYGNNKFSSGVNIGLSAKLDRWRIHLYYLRTIRVKDILFYHTGRNRLDLTVSYHLFGGDKGKKR